MTQDRSPAHNPLERFEPLIGFLAFALYVAERCLAFACLQNFSGSGTGLETQLLEFFFGQPPYSIFNILLGFGPPESLLGILTPRNILQAILQGLQFLANWWIIGMLFRLIAIFSNRIRN